MLYLLGPEIPDCDDSLIGWNNSRPALREYEWFKDWVEKRKSSVPSLKELVAIEIRKRIKSNQDMETVYEDMLIPDEVKDFLYLRHLKPYIDVPHDSDVEEDDDEDYDDDDDDFFDHDDYDNYDSDVSGGELDPEHWYDGDDHEYDDDYLNAAWE